MSSAPGKIPPIFAALLAVIIWFINQPAAIADEVDDLIQETRSESERIRMNAVGQLGQVGGERAVDALIGVLEDESLSIRLYAISSLSTIGDERSVPSITALLADKEKDVRRRALSALQDMDKLPECTTLIELTRDEDPEMRVYAADVLGKACPDTAAPRIMEMLDDTDDSVQRGAVHALTHCTDKDAARVIGPLLDSDDTEMRIEALEYFQESKATGYDEVIAGLLTDRDARTREAAAGALDATGWNPGDQFERINYLFASRKWDELVGMGDCSTGVLTGGLEDPDFDIVEESAKALDRLGWVPGGDDQSFMFLFAMKDWPGVKESFDDAAGRLGKILDSPDMGSSVRQAAATSLSELGTKETALMLVDALGRTANKDDSMIFYAVGTALQKVGTDAMPEMLELFESGDRCGVVLDMMTAEDEKESQDIIKDMIDKPSPADMVMQISMMMGADAVPFIVDGLSHASPSVRCSCIFILAQLCGEDEHRHIIAMVDDRDSEVRATAVLCLAMLEGLNPEEAEPAVLKATEDDDPRVRYAGFLALGNLKTDKAVERLIELTKSDDMVTRRLAVMGLSITKRPECVDAVSALLDDPVDSVVTTAIYALASIDDERSAEELIRLMDDSSKKKDQRLAALSGLAGMKNPKAHDGILSAMESEDRVVRMTAYRSIQYSDFPDKAAYLIQGLSDGSGEIRSACAWGLGTTKDPSAVGPLVAATADPNETVRISAINALGMIGDLSALEHLSTLAYETTDSRTRNSAVYAISYMDDPSARSVLDQMAASDDEALSGMAKSAIEMVDMRKKYEEGADE